ncbi:branched-chain amino acid ABC transporter permease [Variovorax guangxiensis]|uniref:Branched-chain amino acid ABC transporter permease n=1 Tax=Variovorax guangxiensis TaxID=1775474 RepID=A0A502DDC1_9BURK|nr:branched-chain amino acid ABC transporter permease [Variovorax guangxiensis]TPG17498.1 branched-chain amino acid ABC transporter permease [Variovorax ginsengisoli]TPG23585.1 branched-chain amino acid ABC transporter permease [Variovorax guangxiensis]
MKKTPLVMLTTALGLVALFVPFVLSDYQLQVAVMVGIFALLALSLNVLSGYAGMISLGHAGFFLIGSYTSAILATRYAMPFPVSLAAAVALTAASGLLLAVPAMKLSGHFLAVITIAFGLILHLLSINLEFITNGVSGISNIARPGIGGWSLKSDLAYYFFVLGVLALVCLLVSAYTRSGYGRALSALRDDEVAAGCMGVNVNLAKIHAFVISAAIAGLAGCLYAHYVRYINPESFTLDISIRILIMMVVGGIGSIFGSLVGALVVYVLPEALRFLNDYYYLVFGFVIILLMLFLPRGLVSLIPGASGAVGNASAGRGSRP